MGAAAQRAQTKETETMLVVSRTVGVAVDSRVSAVAVGVAAGETAAPYGVWTRGTFSTGRQKATELGDGHQYNVAAATVGVDFGEEQVFGVAYTYAQAHVKSQGADLDKARLPMHIGSLYGLVKQDDFLVQGQLYYGWAKLDKSWVMNSLTGELAKAKPKGTTMGGAVQSRIPIQTR